MDELTLNNPQFEELVNARRQTAVLALFIPEEYPNVRYDNLAMQAELGFAIEFFDADGTALRYMFERIRRER